MNYTFFYTDVFSQWFRSKFTVDGVEYSHAEQYMMHQKALLFGDKETAKKIMEATHPREQKQLGREVSNFDAKIWNEKARDIVYKGNWHKFKQNPQYLKQMLETEGTLLVEASKYDRVWGVGLEMGNKRLNDPGQWRGTNWLGEVLTKVREDIISNKYRMSEFEWK